MSITNSMSAMQAGLDGFHRNIQAFERTAERLSTLAPTGDLATEMVDMMTEVHGVKASAVVIRTADELKGTLIDMFG